MKFLTILALAGAAMATKTKYKPCPSGLFSNALCCATDALGIIGLDCDVRKSHYYLSAPTARKVDKLADNEKASEVPRDPHHFSSNCAKVGQQAKCCVLPVVRHSIIHDVFPF